MRHKLNVYQRAAIITADMLLFGVSYGLAFQLRFDFRVQPGDWDIFWSTAWLVVGCRAIALLAFNSDLGLWRYASIEDLASLIKAVAASQMAVAAGVLFMLQGRFPRSVLLIDPMLGLCLAGLARFSFRLAGAWRRHGDGHKVALPRLLIFGAGDLGESIVRETQRCRPEGYHIVGFVDDDPRKWHHRIHGLSILGGRKDLPRIIAERRVDEIVVAVGDARGQLISELMDLCQDHGREVKLKTVPTLDERLRLDSRRQHGIRSIELKDLLLRKPVVTDQSATLDLLRGKTVLITGAGGTIGSELARQVVRFHPAKVLLLEKHNTALFYIDRELTSHDGATRRLAIAGDVCDPVLLENLFSLHHPDLVFHAAAHKHVALMEANPQEAIKNNTLGTQLLAETAARHGVQRFLYISTDKAVRPSSVMGASKRLGEMVVRSISGASATRFISVRFGNVLGSSGSSVNLFTEQIAHGGPVTVTDREAQRYFMTTEEAVRLILHATSLGRGGEIFVLNMGQPVKIVDLARNLIRLSGLEPERDIKIVFTGLKPGEKLCEELFCADDLRQDTGHSDIFAALPKEADLALLQADLKMLKGLCARPDGGEALLEKVRDLVPGYQPAQSKMASSAELTWSR